MSLRINTNVTAIGALRNLQQTSQAVSTSIERLSSGLRINRSADDPAGLIISEGLRAQIDGMNQAVSNAQDANNLIKTAEGSLAEINSLLRSVRTLAVSASNTGANDVNAVQANQTQIDSALASIQRIATQTQFGAKKLLDGTSGIAAALVDSTRLSGIYVSSTFAGASTSSGNVSVTVSTTATRASVTGAATYASVNATVANAGNIVINGQSISVAASDTVQTVVDKINNLASITGVGANFGSESIVLTQQNFGANFQVSLSESATIINGTTSTSVSGINAVASVQIGSTTATFTGGRASGDSGLRLTDTYGNSILLTEAGNSTTTAGSNVATVTAGALQFQIGANSGQFVLSALGNTQTNSLGNTVVAGSSLRTVDVTTATGASNAIKILDEAISQISVLRAQLGAFQRNTLDSTIRYLGVGVENLSASESQIRDANVAQEVVSLTKNQILQQAGTSVLAQANQQPSQVLSLLR
jgi:flagellin